LGRQTYCTRFWAGGYRAQDIVTDSAPVEVVPYEIYLPLVMRGT
jgi:hypothetical protein